jgi:PTS system nitrogen regulatory IIA component
MDLKIKDVADLLQVSETTIQRWVLDGKLPAYRLKDEYCFSRIEIENWMMHANLKEEESGTALNERQIYSSHEQKGEVHRSGMQQFGLYRAIHQGDVLGAVSGKTKEEVIRATTKAIAPKLNVDAEMLAELLLDRESLMPTSLNHGVAIPHTRDFLRQGPTDMVFVVYPEQPLEYGALDGKPVHTLFFLFASNDKGHLQLLAKLAHFTGHDKAQQFVRTKPGKKELLEFVRDWESVLH